MSKILNLLIPTLDYSNFNKMDIVIEAIIENIQLKQNLFQDLEKYCSKNCILATVCFIKKKYLQKNRIHLQ